MNNTQQAHELGISHITGRPVRPIKELHKLFFQLEEFESLIKTINDIFNCFFQHNGEYNEDGFFFEVSEFRTLFVELVQNISGKDLEVLSKFTGKPVRPISEIYNQLTHKRTLSQNLHLLNEVMERAIYGFSDNIIDPKAHLYLTNHLREIWTEILINIHHGRR